MSRPSDPRDTLISADAFLLAESSWLTGSRVSSSRFSSQFCTEIMPSSYWLTEPWQMVSPSRFSVSKCTRMLHTKVPPLRDQRERTDWISSYFQTPNNNLTDFSHFQTYMSHNGSQRTEFLSQMHAYGHMAFLSV